MIEYIIIIIIIIIMKSTTTINLDTEILMSVRAKNLNLSEVINNYLKEFLNIKEDNKGKRLSQLRDEVIKTEAELAKKKQLIKTTEERTEKEKGVIVKFGN
jgi:uncharacterized small protein (DUF1192 family)